MNVSSKGEATFALQCRALKLPAPTIEYRFDSARRWRFDFAWPDALIAVEVEGGLFSGGRHTRGAGYQADLDKYNAATLQGWAVYRFSTNDVMSGDAIQVISRALSPFLTSADSTGMRAPCCARSESAHRSEPHE